MNALPKVLLVDDDPAVRGALKFALELDGYSVETFSTAEALAGRERFPERGCLVLGHRLPGMGGLDLLQTLRERRVRLPAILVATHPDRALRRRAETAGVSVLEKPLLCDALSRQVRALTAEAA